MTFRQHRGAQAERLALGFLRRRGLELLDRNYRCRTGELDLVMADRDCTVVVEVRARAPGSRVPALQTVDDRKQRKIILTTELWLAHHARFADRPLRFDVVAIEHDRHGPSRLQWVRDAFRA